MKNHYLFILLFILFLWAPIAGNIFKYQSSIPENYKKLRDEQRVKYKNLEYNKDGIVEYIRNIENWYKDNFSFKYELVKLNSLIYRFISTSPNSHQVIFGENGFLFGGNVLNNVVDKSIGIDLFQESELGEYYNKLLKADKYLANKNIDFYITIAPNKHTIYPEYLPTYLKGKIESPIFTRYDQLLKINKNNIPIVDLRKPLIAAKNEYDDMLFYKTDTHWNLLGAYYGFDYLIRSINKHNNYNIPLLDIDNVEISPKNIGGDLANKLNLLTELVDFNVDITFSNECQKTSVYNLFEENNSQIYPYGFSVPNRKDCICEGSNTNNNTILLLKDSFSTNLSYLLNQTFGKVIYIHLSSPRMNELMEIIEYYEPDIVLLETVERLLEREINPEQWIDKERFKNAKILKQIEGKEIIDNLEKTLNVSLITTNNQLVKYKQKEYNKKTMFFFKQIKSPKANNYYIKCKITVPNKTIARLYFSTKAKPNFNDSNSEKIALKKGENKIYFNIIDKGFNGRFRIDIGHNSKNCILHNIELRHE